MQKDPHIGESFLHWKQVYHLGSSTDDRIVIDKTYYYSSGFVSSDVVKVTEKRWSEYYKPEPGDIQRLDALAEAVQHGMGHRKAYEELGISGALSKHSSPEVDAEEREFTWFLGRQEVEDVKIELMRSPDYGNRLSTKFLQ